MNFAIGIPCYNCKNTIDRLMFSIASQENVKIKVYICDDSDNDELEEYLNNTNYFIDIIYYRRENNYHHHCPGNTRHSLLKRMLLDDSDYICFIDNDDMFEENVFSDVSSFIVDNNYPEFIFTPFREWNEEKNEYIQEITGSTWLHGNFYKTEFLRITGIQFKKDLFTHEDLYFNCLVDAMLLANNIEKKVMNLFIYKWVFMPDSLSRKGFRTGEHCFIERHLNDYIHCASDPFIEVAKVYPNLGPIAYQQCINTLLYSYFYHQGAIYHHKDKIIPENDDFVSSYIYKIIKNV